MDKKDQRSTNDSMQQKQNKPLTPIQDSGYSNFSILFYPKTYQNSRKNIKKHSNLDFNVNLNSLIQSSNSLPRILCDFEDPKLENKISSNIIIGEQEKVVSVGCKCSKSNCLRMYCTCFRNQGFCSEECTCKNCLNKQIHQQARQFAIKKTQIILQDAFVKKVIQFQGSLIYVHGCSCTSSCKFNYCICKRNNSRCSNICQCKSCKNDKLKLSQQQKQMIFMKRYRKKDKLKIQYDESKPDSNKIVFEKFYVKAKCKDSSNKQFINVIMKNLNKLWVMIQIINQKAILLKVQGLLTRISLIFFFILNHITVNTLDTLVKIQIYCVLQKNFKSMFQINIKLK